MTATLLQEELCQELRTLFQNALFKDSNGIHTKLNVFAQHLPIRKTEEEPDQIPYIIVRLESGTTKSATDPQEVAVMLLFGYFDDNLANNGQKGVLEMIQKIQERFEKEPMLSHQFMFQYPFEWALQEEESFPYFFGAASMTFQTAAIRKEDRFT